MELLNETLDLLEKYEKERKKTISDNSATPFFTKEDNKGNSEDNKKENQEDDSNPRESTTESNITRINSVRSSNSIDLRLEGNSDNEDDTENELSDDEFRSFPDETTLAVPEEKETIKYDSNYYDYISQKNSRMRFNSLPSSDSGRVVGTRSRSNSSVSTPELLVYDSNDYDSSSSYGSYNTKPMYNQSFTYGYSNPYSSSNSVNKSLSGNRIFQNNQLIDSCETLLNDLEGEIVKSDTSSAHLSQSSSDFVIPQRSISLLDSTRKARHKSFHGPSHPSPIFQSSSPKPQSELNKIQTDLPKEENQSDSSKTIPSPSTPIEPHVPSMSRSFSVSSSNVSPNISFNSEYGNLRPISSLYRKHSLGSHDQRVSRSTREKRIDNKHLSSFDNIRSRSMSPSYRKASISSQESALRGKSSSTPPSLLPPSDSILPPLSNALETSNELPHKYTSHPSVESEINVKEAGRHFGQLPKNQISILDQSFMSNVTSNSNDNRKSVLTNTSNNTSLPPNGKMNSNDSNSGLLTPRSLPATPESMFNTSFQRDPREVLSLPVSRRKSSIPQKPIALFEEPQKETMDQVKSTRSSRSTHSFQSVSSIPTTPTTPSSSKNKFPEKEVFDTLIQLLDQLESNQNIANSEKNQNHDPSNTITDTSIQEALNHLEQSYFPEGCKKPSKDMSTFTNNLPAPQESLPAIPKSPKITTNVDSRLSSPKGIKKDSLERAVTPNNTVGSVSDSDSFKLNMNSPARLRGQEELSRILHNSAPSLHVKSKKERQKEQQQLKLLQLQQKQEYRIKMIQQQQQQLLQQQQQQQLQIQLKQQINQKLQQNAMIQQQLRQLADPKALGNYSPVRMVGSNDFDPYSPVSDLNSYNQEFNEGHSFRLDSKTPTISPATPHASMENVNVLSPKSPRIRKTSFGHQTYNNPLIPGKEIATPLSSSYDSMNEMKLPSAYPSIKTGGPRVSPNTSFNRISMMAPHLSPSPNIPSKSFSIDVPTNDKSFNAVQQPSQKLFSRSPTAQSVDISSSEEAKRQRRSKKTSIFYIPPDNSSKPLSAVVSDVSDVSNTEDNETLDTITKNNTIMNSKSHPLRTSFYKNGGYNLSADNLPLLKEQYEMEPATIKKSNSIGSHLNTYDMEPAPIKKSNSIGSHLNTYDMVESDSLPFKKIDLSHQEGETFIERFMNEINITTGFENNILKQRAKQQEEERKEMEMRRRTMNMTVSDQYTPSHPINISSSMRKDLNPSSYGSYGSYGSYNSHGSNSYYSKGVSHDY